MFTVHLVRHAETEQAAHDFFAGDIDPPLTDRGRLQATAVARLAASLGLAGLFVSPKLRARMTADPVARACGLPPVYDYDLREIAYGSWEGRAEADVEAAERQAYAAWSDDPALCPPPGGEGALAVAARAMSALGRARAAYSRGAVMMISHKATIRALACALLGAPIARFRDRIACPAASVTTFEIRPRGGPMLVRVGDVHHLV